MNENEMVHDDEISLFDLWEKLRNGWRYVFGGTVIGAVGALAAIVLVAPTYEATITFQVARIGGAEVEAPATVIERFKLPAFLLVALQQVGNEKLINALLNSPATVAEIGSAQLVKGTALVQLTTKGRNPESARKLGEVVLAQFVERHEALGAPLREKILSDIGLIKDKIAVAERELNDLSKVIASSAVKDSQFAPMSLLASQRIQKQTEHFALRQQLTALELLLLPPATQPTRALEATYVPTKPVSPKKTLLLALGLIGGLLAGVVSVFFVDAWRRAKRERLGIASLSFEGYSADKSSTAG